MQWQGGSKRKESGGRIIRARGKRKFELGREPADPVINEVRRIGIPVMGGNSKVRLLRCNIANVTDPKTKSTRQTKIITVTGNPANVHYVRRNILTKGAVIKTEIGSARITNRPAQDGAVNAVLLQEQSG